MRVGTRRFGSAPWLSRFCETNVRTYVTDRQGRSGIWFFSLDATRLGAVITARTTYRLPYFWSRMRLERDGGRITYGCHRLWPGPSHPGSRVELTVGAPFSVDELHDLDHFLTARWALFSVAGRHGDRHRYALAVHDPWPLHRVDVLKCDDELVEAAGLPRPKDPPIVHFSDGVPVRSGGHSPMDQALGPATDRAVVGTRP